MAFTKLIWVDTKIDPHTGVEIPGTPLSANNLNRLEEGIYDAYESMKSLDKNRNDIDIIKQNQLIILIQQDIQNKSTEMDVGYWFDSLKDSSKIKTTNLSLSDNFLHSTPGQFQTCTFHPHDVGFVSNKITYYHTDICNNIKDFECEFTIHDTSLRDKISVATTNVIIKERID